MSRTFDFLYFGWSQAKGIWGDEFVHSVFHHIFNSRKTQDQFVPEKLRISIRNMELNIIKEISSRTLVRTFVDYQSIPIVDITYATKIKHNGDFYVCLLVLGYDPYTGFPIHLYVYQTKSDDDATRFISLVIRKTNTREIRKRFIEIENMLLEDNKIDKSQLRNNRGIFHVSNINGSNSNSMSLNSSNDDRSMTSLANTVQDPKMDVFEESQSKTKSKTYLLLPPRDYDTIHRRHKNFAFEANQYNHPVEHLPFSKMNE